MRDTWPISRQWNGTDVCGMLEGYDAVAALPEILHLISMANIEGRDCATLEKIQVATGSSIRVRRSFISSV
jgi:hypothetical protein